MEYQILVADNLTALEQEVNRLCKKGWKPQGGVQVWMTTWHQEDSRADLRTAKCAQAMVKEES